MYTYIHHKHQHVIRDWYLTNRVEDKHGFISLGFLLFPPQTVDSQQRGNPAYQLNTICDRSRHRAGTVLSLRTSKSSFNPNSQAGIDTESSSTHKVCWYRGNETLLPRLLRVSEHLSFIQCCWDKYSTWGEEIWPQVTEILLDLSAIWAL